MYGNTFYGKSIYGVDYAEYYYFEKLIEITNEKYELVVKFKNRNGFLLYTWSKNSGSNIVNSLSFSFNKNGCDKLTITLNISTDELGFRFGYMDEIEVYLYSNEYPFWSGFVFSPAEEYTENNIYTFTAYGWVYRLNYILINGEWQNESIDNIIRDITEEITVKEPKIFIGKLERIERILSSFYSDNMTAGEVLKKLVVVGGNLIYGVDGRRNLYIKKQNKELQDECVFDVENPFYKINITKGSMDKVVNTYIIEKKASDGSGSSNVLGSINTGDDRIIALNGLIRQIDSINVFGEIAKKEQVPETISHIDAMRYGVFKCSLTAFPDYKASIKNIPITYFKKRKLADGICYIYNKERYYIEEFENCEDINRWFAQNFHTVSLSDIRYSGKYSILWSIGENAVNNTGIYCQLKENLDLTFVKSIKFYLRSEKDKEYIRFWIIDTNDNRKNFDLYLTYKNNWVYFNIDISDNKGFIKQMGFEILNTNLRKNNIYIDSFEIMVKTKRKYELEINKIEYNFNVDKSYINIEAGIIEVPFIQDYVNSIRNIESLKAISKKI